MTNSTTAAQPLDLAKQTFDERFSRDSHFGWKPLDYWSAGFDAALIAQARAAQATIKESLQVQPAGAADTTASASGDCSTCGGSESISDPRGWQFERVPCPNCATLAPVAAQQAAAHQDAVECDSALRAEPASRVLSAVADLADEEIAEICVHVRPTHFAGNNGDVDYLRYDAAVVRAVVTELAARCRAEGGDTSNNESSNLAAKAPAAQADERITKLRTALKEISEVRFGYDGDCGTTRIAEDALYADECAASPASTPEASQQAAAVAAPSKLPKWIDDHKGKDPFMDDVIAYIEKLLSNRNAATTSEDARDAARYRWLRARHVDAGMVEVRDVRCFPESTKAYMRIGGFGKSLDDQVDRQIEAQRATQQEGGE